MCDRLPTFVRTRAILSLGFLMAMPATADDLLYRYEGNAPPYDESAGWNDGDPCEDPCIESVEDGHFVLRWPVAGDIAAHGYTIADRSQEPPPTLWVEWRFRSNHPIGPYFYSCDGMFIVHYRGMSDAVYMYGDAVVAFGGGDYVLGLDIEDFHTYRVESLDGVNYWVSVDGLVFLTGARDQPNGYHYLTLASRGGCTGDQISNQMHEWDFVRYGTISYGEQIVASEPPAGFVDARKHASLDRFTVTFDSPNYVYIDEVTVTVTGGDAPAVTQTRRRENDGSETVEIVLDRPILMGETTRFTFDDGVAINEVEYTFALGDTDGDGDADLHDFAAFQRCFDLTDLTDACLALDFNADDTIDLDDYDVLQEILEVP